MTGTLSDKQKNWLRGLKFAERMIPMCATELGDPEVSELQSLDLIRITNTLEGKHWHITKAGHAALTENST